MFFCQLLVLSFSSLPSSGESCTSRWGTKSHTLPGGLMMRRMMVVMMMMMMTITLTFWWFDDYDNCLNWSRKCVILRKSLWDLIGTNLANYKAKTKQNLGFCHFSFFWSDSSFLVSCTFIQATLTQNSGFDQIGKQEILLQQRLSRTGFASVAESGFGMWGVEEDLALEEEEDLAPAPMICIWVRPARETSSNPT